MATLSAINPTFLDLAQVLGPDDKVARIIEILNQKNEMLEYVPAIEGNLLTGHVTTMRTGIPEPTFRKMYGGVQPTKSTNVKITDSCGMLENYAEVDQALADLNNNTDAFRLSENMPIIEGFAQKISRYFFYGNEDTEPEAFTGLAPRYSTLSGTAQNIDHVISGAGAGSVNTSIWLCVMGENTGHFIYPKGSKAGLTMTDKGLVTIELADPTTLNSGRMEAYRTHYRWDIGLSIRDWRYFVRIANIDSTLLVKNAATGADLIDLMTQALEIVQDTNAGKPFFVANRLVKSFLRRQIVNKVASGTLTMDAVAGKHVMFFEGIPVLRSDALLNTEATIA